MFTLLLLSFAMFIGCYFAGCIPLMFNLKRDKLKMITVFGAGLLVGTALTVIIPEGVHTMYDTQHSHAHSPHGGTLISASLSNQGGTKRRLLATQQQPRTPIIRDVNIENIARQLQNQQNAQRAGAAENAQDLSQGSKSGSANLIGSPNDNNHNNNQNNNNNKIKANQGAAVVAAALKATKLSNALHHHNDHHGEHEHGDETQEHASHDRVHKLIGVALILGFVFMFLIDNCCNRSSAKTSTSTVSSSRLSGSAGQETHKTSLPVFHRIKLTSRNLTASIGLIIHAAADGIAMGAASSTSQFRMEMIIFVAIMLHKGPAAFGLVSFLLHDTVDRDRIRRHLLVFSLAAPVTAILTYISLSNHNKEHLASIHATGIALLFSAGTFLYVATVHVLPELLALSTTPPSSAYSSSNSPATAHPPSNLSSSAASDAQSAALPASSGGSVAPNSINDGITSNGSIDVMNGDDAPTISSSSVFHHHQHHHNHHPLHNYSPNYQQQHQHHHHFNYAEMAVFIGGCLLPLLLSMGHSH